MAVKAAIAQEFGMANQQQKKRQPGSPNLPKGEAKGGIVPIRPAKAEFERVTDLTVGVLGVLCLKFRADFWLATAIANAVWLLGDAVGHVRQMTLNNNHASNNSGIFLVTEIIMPLVILSLALYHRRREGKVT
jgi:hypothetical protein